MPPPPANPTVNQPTTSQENTRALLRSLEELRDSLSSRVEELSGAVERLRGQAGALQRVLDEDWNSSPGNGVGIGARAVRAEEPNAPSASANAPAASLIAPNPRTTSQPVPTAISREVSSLSRPITNDEIHTLLDRAAQSASTPTSTSRLSTSTADPWMVRAQTIENRIRRLNETARELRQRATQTLEESPRGSPVTYGLGPGWREEGLRNSSTSGIGNVPSTLGATAGATSFDAIENTTSTSSSAGLMRLLARVREDQERLEAGIRRLNTAGVRSRPARHRGNVSSSTSSLPRMEERGQPQIPQVIIPPAMSRRERSRTGVRGTASRSRGLPPTNSEIMARQPSPQVIRTLPISPAETVKPELPQDNGRSRSVHESTGHPAADHAPPFASAAIIAPVAAPRSMPDQGAQQSSSSENDDSMRGLARVIVDAARTAPPLRNAPRVSREDSLTYRGMTVASRMNDEDEPQIRRPARRHDQGRDEMAETFDSMLPTLRRLLDASISSIFPTADDDQHSDAGLRRGRANREVSIPPIDESPMEETVRLLEHVPPTEDSPVWRVNVTEFGPPANAHDPDQEFRSFLLEMDDENTSRTRTFDYMAALGGGHVRVPSPAPRLPPPSRLQRDTTDEARFSADNIAIFVDIGQGNYLPLREALRETGDAGVDSIANDTAPGEGVNRNETAELGRPRSREDADRLRAERQAARDRLNQSRAALRQVQRLRRDMNLVRQGPPVSATGNENENENTNDIGGMNIELNMDLENAGPTPTQGISAAGALDNEVEMFRALVVDAEESDSDGSEQDDAATVFEGSGERTEGTAGQGPAHRPAVRSRIGAQASKEAFETNLHLWPSSGLAMGRESKRVYQSMTQS